MEAISRLVIFSICVTALCRLSASTPYEKYVRFLGAVLLGAQLVGSVLSLVGQDGGGLWSQIVEKGATMEEKWYGDGSIEWEERSEEMQQELWSRSQEYWNAQLEETERESIDLKQETGDEILPVIIQVEEIAAPEGESRKE